MSNNAAWHSSELNDPKSFRYHVEMMLAELRLKRFAWKKQFDEPRLKDQVFGTETRIYLSLDSAEMELVECLLAEVWENCK